MSTGYKITDTKSNDGYQNVQNKYTIRFIWIIHLSTLNNTNDRQRSIYLTQPEVSELPEVLNGT